MRWAIHAARLLSLTVTLGAGRDLVRGADSPLGQARTGIEQWVEARQLLSRTRADWEGEKEMLVQSKGLYERELRGLDEQMTRVSTNSTQVDRERAVAEKELQEANDTLAHARGSVALLEQKIRVLLPRLPAPLTDAMKALVARLPDDSESTKLGAVERAQTVVSVLNEIDKFNNAVSIYSEKRQNPAGEEISVETVYVGLGAAYFVNQTGDFAGTGRPGANGWEWTADPRLAGPVREVVRIYRGERTATFVPLPVSIQ
ncbi:MAG: DUF3450 family protein [Verrucomicrobiales bacterium]|nr:DUF3450 family protein [Verrucomicrobiales bacterium]